MTIVTKLVSSSTPSIALAEKAVEEALNTAGIRPARGILLFMTPDFSHDMQSVLNAVARKAQCLQVAGGLAAGVFTEEGWSTDRPSLAMMVFGSRFYLSTPLPDDTSPILSYCGRSYPVGWLDQGMRFGGVFSAGFSGSSEPDMLWRQAKIEAEEPQIDLSIGGADISLEISSGLELLSPPMPVTKSCGLDIEKIASHTALETLVRALPFDLRENFQQHAACITALIAEKPEEICAPFISNCLQLPIISFNRNGSISLAGNIQPGQHLAWAIRRPVATEADMHEHVKLLAQKAPSPAAALMFSCIGRGPLFYDGDDLDLKAVKTMFPKIPILGMYGTGQIVPAKNPSGIHNQIIHHAVLTALISSQREESHV